MFPEAPPITFFQWLLLNFPISCIYLVLVWLLFAYCYCPKPSLIQVDVESIRYPPLYVISVDGMTDTPSYTAQ